MKILRFIGTGYHHEQHNKGCQDRLKTLELDNGTVILAVSDGCSSSAYAEAAAQCNVDTVAEIFSNCSIDDLSFDKLAELYPEMKAFEGSLRDNIRGCFEFIFNYKMSKLTETDECKDAVSASDFCATLLFAVCEREKTLIGHIGDGYIMCFDKDATLTYASGADNGESSCYTYFTVSSDFCEHFRYDTIPSDSFESIVLFSDGPQKMFEGEADDVETSVRDILVTPVTNGEITTEAELAKALSSVIGHAKYYVFDDWSIIFAHKTEKHKAIEPVSLLSIFRAEFAKIRFDENGNIINDVDKVSDEGVKTEPSEAEKSADAEKPAVGDEKKSVDNGNAESEVSAADKAMKVIGAVVNEHNAKIRKVARRAVVNYYIRIKCSGKGEF